MTALWKPMLAAHPDPAELDAALRALRYPVLASPKLDGIRATVQGGRLYTRSLKPVANKAMQALWGCKEFNGLDGEIICGSPTAEDCFNRTTGQVRRASGGTEGACFYVFDHYTSAEFTVRTCNASDVAGGAVSVLHLKHKLCSSYKELATYEDVCLKKGYEGICVRSPEGLYKQGRSTLKEGGLIAVKRTVDAEAVILDTFEQQENQNEKKLNELGRMKRSGHAAGKVGKGTLGGFRVALYKGAQGGKITPENELFNIGTGLGLTDAVRAELWSRRKKLPGQIIKFRYQGVGTMNAPRQPVFLGFRDGKDMG